MNLREYFEQADGVGVLSTADASGHVDTAIYARPHVMDEKTVSFVMADKKSYQNLQANPYAAYLFKVNVNGYSGLRLYLTKTAEERDTQRIRSLVRDSEGEKIREDELRLVSFRVYKVLGLTGAGKCPVDMLPDN